MPIVKFFLDNARLNYTLALFLFIAGIYSYIVIPKEIFPPLSLNKIAITGGYSGASADNLDKIATINIEDRVKSISGITKVESTIKAGSFSTILTLKEGANIDDILNRVKDAISIIKQDLPSDMNEPTATNIEHKIPLMQVAISSKFLSYDELMDVAKDIKSKISKVENLTDVALYGEASKEIRVSIDSKKLRAYSISPKDAIAAISNLSYIYPVGKIEERGSHLYITTTYGKSSKEEYLETIITISQKRIKLRDIANVDIYYPKGDTISSFNGVQSLNLNISKDESGNAIALSKKVKEILKEFEKSYENISISPYSDTSIYIENRLNTVVSNITLGFILVFFSLFFLINGRISLVVAAGIPFSFIIGLIFFNLSDNSINMISLLGALIAIGVLVDDAIIVAENIQRHIEEGMAPKEAALIGTKEVAMPVIMATLTTIFAFTPMLLMSGEMGQFIKMIPIAVAILVAASLVESFLFLPTHAKHLLRENSKTLSWRYVNDIYKSIISLLIVHKYIALFLFVVCVPLATFFGFKASKFQFFPPFDSTQIYVNGSLEPGVKIEESFEIVNALERALLEKREEFFIKSTSAVAGVLVGGSDDNGDVSPNLFVIFVELYEPIGENFVDRYISPILSFDFDKSEKIRDIPTFELESAIASYLKPLAQKYALESFSVEAQRAGVIKRDIEIKLQSNSDELVMHHIEQLKKRLKEIDGVINIGDDAKAGVDELKIELNSYGESLGLSERDIASALSGFFHISPRAKSFDSSGIIDITTLDIDRDNLETLEEFELFLSDGRRVKLSDVVSFNRISSFEKILKENGEKQRSVYAFIEPKKTTALEVQKELQGDIERIENDGIVVILGGEKEQSQRLAKDMMVASMIALFLMFLSLLVMFNSFKYTFMILAIIPFSFLGVLIGHFFLGLHLSMPSIIGILGLSGVVINDGIVMLDFLRKSKNAKELLDRATMRLRPVILTSLTTIIGLSTLMFFPSGQAKILQPLAISLGFGLAWGSVMTLFFLPTLYAVVNKIDKR